MVDNHVHLIKTSNKDWVVRAGTEERRFYVIDVGNGCAQNHEYFKEMMSELEAGGREALLYEFA